MPDKKLYYPEFDLIRIFISAAIAFIFHYGGVYNAYPFSGIGFVDWLYKYSSYGVEMFFILSGFVMYLSYFNKIRESKISFSEFFTDRIKRLYPVMIITVIICAVGELCFKTPVVAEPGSSRTTLTAVIFNLLGLQSGWVGNHTAYSVAGPTWFISILMICYLAFFIILKLCKCSKSRENLCFALLVILGIFLYLNPKLNFPFLYRSCGRGYLGFFMGIFLAKVQNHVDSTKKQILISVLSALGIATFFLALNKGTLGNTGLMFALLLHPCVVMLIINVKIFRIITDNKVFRYLGKISFGIFLWNVPVIIWFKRFDNFFELDIDYSRKLTLIILAVINTVAAVLSYHFIEQKLAKLFSASKAK